VRTFATVGALGLAVVSAAVSSAAEPGAPLPLTSQLSADTTAYVYRVGWDDLRAQLGDSPVRRNLEGPAVRAFYDELTRMGSRPDDGGAAFALVLKAMECDVVFAGLPDPNAATPPTTQPATAEEQERREERSGRPGWQPPLMASDHFAIVTPPAARRDEFGKLTLRITDLWHGEARRSGAYHVLGHGDTKHHLAWTGERLIWANGPRAAELAQLPERAATLKDAPLFRDATGPLLAGRATPPIALYYYDLRPLWATLRRTAQSAGAWDQVSWRSLTAVAGASFVEDGGFRNRHYWRIGDVRTGMFKLTRDATINADWLQRVPAEASGFTTGVWDPYSFCVSMAALGLGLADPTSERETLEKLPMYMMGAQPMLKGIGPRYLLYRVPGRYSSFAVASGFFPIHDAVVVLELRDPNAALSALDTLTGLAGGFITVQRTRYAEAEVRQINVIYASFQLAIVDNVALVTMQPQLMKDALENWHRPGPALIDTPAYKAAARRLVERPCFEMYFAPDGFTRGIYDNFIPQLQQGVPMVSIVSRMWGEQPTGDPNQVFSMLSLPRGSDLSAGMTQGTILSARDDGQGVLFDGWSPLLSTTYEWPYVHLCLHLGGDSPLETLSKLTMWLMTPTGEGAATSQPGVNTQGVEAHGEWSP
jgi:hypothetical protein